MADRDISAGSCERSVWGNAMTTEVSSSPRSCRDSGTRRGVLVEDAVDVGAEPGWIDPRGSGERAHDDFRRDEAATLELIRTTTRWRVVKRAESNCGAGRWCPCGRPSAPRRAAGVWPPG